MIVRRRITRVWRFLALSCLSAAALAGPVVQGVPPREITDPKTLTSSVLAGAEPVSIDDLYNTRNTYDAVWTPDGANIVVSTDLAGRLNLWKVPVDGGFPVQLSRSDDRQWDVAVSPDGAWAVFQSDHGGNEMNDLYAVPIKGGATVNLTGTDAASESNPNFSPDGKLLGFDQIEKTTSFRNVAVMDVAQRKIRVLTKTASPDDVWYFAAFSPDGRSVIANRQNAIGTSSSIWRIDIETGKAEPLTDVATSANNVAQDVSPDGRFVSITTEATGGILQAALLDLRTRQISLVKPDPWEQHAGYFSPDSRTLLAVSNVDGRDTVWAYDIAAKRATRVALPEGVNSDINWFASLPKFSPDSSRILAPHQSAGTPIDYWVVDRASNRATQVTRLGLASIDPARLPRTQVVHYRSEDGTVISALVWLPFNRKRDAHAPGVVLPHGGPAYQTTDTFNPTATALASRGYVVIAPNPRGSTGYGLAFQKANYQDIGGGDLVDTVYGAKFLVATGYVDPKKIGITGGSYGGYMTLMAAGKTPDIWAAAVEKFGIVNWLSFYENASPTFKLLPTTLLGDPVANRALYEAASPSTYLKNIRAPMLVLQGDNDRRVAKAEAVQVVNILKSAGKIVDAHYYPNEGHGFFKRENQIDALERLVAWFDKYLKGPAASAR